MTSFKGNPTIRMGLCSLTPLTRTCSQQACTNSHQILSQATHYFFQWLHKNIFLHYDNFLEPHLGVAKTVCSLVEPSKFKTINYASHIQATYTIAPKG